MNLTRRNHQIQEIENPISQPCLFEKLNRHASNLLDEVKNRMNDFQSSFETSLRNIKSDSYRRSCNSMEEYLSIIQNLNRDFNDLEKMSYDLVTHICQLRAKSVTVDGLMNFSENAKQESHPDNQRITINPASSQVTDSAIQIEDFPAIKIEISDDQSEEQIKVPVFNSDELQVQKKSLSESVQSQPIIEKKRSYRSPEGNKPVIIKKLKLANQSTPQSTNANAAASRAPDLKVMKRMIPLSVALSPEIAGAGLLSPKFKICFEEANGVKRLVAKKID